ncbi:MAG: rhodanese-like domain-containing protein, partial [Actinomycetota bacterium]|nr:rhodanese-like domain-containing protein [Actinomycetota bacterium]
MIAPVVAADSLAALLAASPGTVLADVRWYLDGRDGRAAFEAQHLPGAVWVDLEGALAAHDLPATEGRHPLPIPQAFAAAMGALGIGDHTEVVAYDDTGGLTAARLVAMLRMLGRDAALLDGGLTAWVADGRSTESGPGTTPTPAPFTSTPWPAHRLATADEAAAHAAAGGPVLDARVHERFTGEQALIDPRPGHVPGARNAPWAATLAPDGRLRSPAELRAHYEALGAADPDAAPITYCGSGVSACMNLVAMEHAGLQPARLYV